MRNLWLLFLVGLATGLVSEKLLVYSQPTVTMDDLYLELEGRTSGDLPPDDEDGEDDGSGSGSGDYIFRDFTEYYVRTTQSSESVPNKPEPTANSPHVPATTAADSQHPTTVMDSRMAPDTVTDGAGKKDEEHANIGSTADWFTHRTTMTHSTPPSETTRVSVDDNVDKDREEDNSVDEKDVPTSTTIEDVHPTNENNNEIVPIDGRGRNFYNMGKSEEVTSENLWQRTEVLAAVIACGVVGFLCAVFLLLLLAYRMKKKDEGSYDLGDTKLSNTQYHKAPTKEFYA